ncbi:MAG: ABC transporter ATP-binding protein [Limisphaerales bacterium]|nr:MAG: ABC transporter ATP-binding protein [Limisphaerales bacterium]|tara:strand:+ start:195 stop:566 length:372 start_codon:yes stop_codon:yes gene_type:complete
MSEDPNQPTNSRQDSKANEPPLIEPTVTKLKKAPPKSQVTPQGVLNALWIIMQLGILAILGIFFVLVYINLGWSAVWKVTLIGTSGLFAIMSLLVIIGGALDVRKLFRRLQEQHDKTDSKAID